MINALLFVSVCLNIVLALTVGFVVGQRASEKRAEKTGLEFIQRALKTRPEKPS